MNIHPNCGYSVLYENLMLKMDTSNLEFILLFKAGQLFTEASC